MTEILSIARRVGTTCAFSGHVNEYEQRMHLMILS